MTSPALAIAIIGGCIAHACALSFSALSRDATAAAARYPVDGPLKANEFLENSEMYQRLEVLIRKNMSGAEKLSRNIFDEKRKTSTKILSKLAEGGEDAPASEAYGTLVAVTNSSTPAAVCLPQASSVPWLRLLLRINGQEEWSDLHDRIVNKAVAKSLTVVEGQNITGFLKERGDAFVKTVIVRDPVTRILFTFLETCRSGGEWTDCMSPSGHPVTFDEMVQKLEDVGTETAPENVRKQLDACSLRTQKFDLLGWQEDLGFSAEAFLRQLEQWSSVGEKGWGEQGDAKFSDIFPLDNTHEKVCDFYTPKLLRIVHRLYKEDFEAFGYDVNQWTEMCTAKWEQAGEDEKEINTHPIPTPGRYKFPFYHHATKCTPTSEELHAMARGEETNFEKAAALKFYIHEDGAFDFNDTLSCFLSQYGMNSTDDWDDHVHANISEHLGEIWLLKALREHPQRTMDKQEADLHVIATLPFISYMATQEGDDGATCGTVEDHEQRMLGVTKALRALPGFQNSNGKNFFIFTTHFRLQEMYTDPLLKLLNEGNVMVGTADIDYTHWKDYPNIRRKIILPYKAHYLVENGAFNEDRNVERPIDVIFRGKISRSNEGSSRQVMWDVMQINDLNLDIQDVKFVNEAPSFSDELAQKYGHSRFCLAPAGDSPTSRRLFDALAGGCVPLALGDYDKLYRNLPFTRTIDWTKIVLYGGSLPCVDTDVVQSKAWLEVITDANRLEHSMRMAGLEAFRGALSFAGNGTGLVSALLTEIVHVM